MNEFEKPPSKAEGQPIYTPEQIEMAQKLAQSTHKGQKFKRLDAYLDLIEYLEDGEAIETLVFGEYGWGGYGEDTEFIPKEKQGVLMTLEEAKPMMHGWTYDCGYGSPQCYATYVWTNRRVIWVTQYDGPTTLNSAPRHPINCIPDMPGG